MKNLIVALTTALLFSVNSVFAQSTFYGSITPAQIAMINGVPPNGSLDNATSALFLGDSICGRVMI
jgi:hypothetical protein